MLQHFQHHCNQPETELALLLLWYYRFRSEEKGRTPAWFGLHPNAAAITLDYPLARGKSDPRSRKLAPVEPLEHRKDVFVKFRIDSNSVVANGNRPFLPNPFG